MRPSLSTDLKEVPKSVAGQQTGAATPQLNQCIGGNSCAVTEIGQLGHRLASPPQSVSLYLTIASDRGCRVAFKSRHPKWMRVNAWFIPDDQLCHQLAGPWTYTESVT